MCLVCLIRLKIISEIQFDKYNLDLIQRDGIRFHYSYLMSYNQRYKQFDMQNLIKVAIMLIFVIIAQGASENKLVKWNKVLFTTKVMMSNQTTLLNNFFNDENGSFSVSTFKISDKQFSLMLADGIKSNYSKRIIIKASYNIPEIMNNADKTLKHEIKGCTTLISMEQQVDNEQLLRHWEQYQFESKYLYNFTYITQKQLVLYSKAIKINMVMEDVDMDQFFSSFTMVKNINLLSVIFIIFEGFLFWYCRKELGQNIKNLYSIFWPFTFAYLKHIIIITQQTSKFQAALLILGVISLLFVAFCLMMCELEHQSNNGAQRAGIILQFLLGIFLCFWFNWLIISIFIIIESQISHSPQRKLDNYVLVHKKTVTITIVIQYQLLIWLNSCNPGICPFLFDNFSYPLFQLSWIEMILVEIVCLIALSEFNQREKKVQPVLSDEDRQKIMRRQKKQ